MNRRFIPAFIILILGYRTIPGSADAPHIAVAANFAAAMKELVRLFEESQNTKLIVSYGSTGQLYAQIINGAPFDVLLAADSARPFELERQGFGIAGSRFTYATGRLVLWSRTCAGTDLSEAHLTKDQWGFCAIANPRTAPYGWAAKQVLQRLGLWELDADRIVRGRNIAHAWQLVAGGNASIGFVALSQIRLLRDSTRGSCWIVPQSYYSPILQQAILLKRDVERKKAEAFLTFLREPDGVKVIRKYGYTAGE